MRNVMQVEGVSLMEGVLNFKLVNLEVEVSERHYLSNLADNFGLDHYILCFLRRCLDSLLPTKVSSSLQSDVNPWIPLTGLVT